MKKSILMIVALSSVLFSTPAMAETRCGYVIFGEGHSGSIEFYDAQGMWRIADAHTGWVQQGDPAIDKLINLLTGNKGNFCVCMEVKTLKSVWAISRIDSAKIIPQQRCLEDKNIQTPW